MMMMMMIMMSESASVLVGVLSSSRRWLPAKWGRDSDERWHTGARRRASERPAWRMFAVGRDQPTGR